MKKEAAILGWRFALDHRFLLIPVTLRGQSTALDLGRGYFGSLGLDRCQCVRDADCAADIVAGVKAQFGDRATLAERCGQTPLARLRQAAAALLREADPGSITAALAALNPGARPVGMPGEDPQAQALARRLLDPQTADGDACFTTFQTCILHLKPRKTLRTRVWDLFHHIRSLWVHPGAAAYLPHAREQRRPVALRGHYVLAADPDQRPPEPYTLARYLERAWPETLAYKIVLLAQAPESADQVKDEIRAQFLPALQRRHTPLAAQDASIKTDPRTITSRTRLETLTAEVDQLRRLHDANVHRAGDTLKPDGGYLNPGIFWWAFAPAPARCRGLPLEVAQAYQAELDYPGIDRGRGAPHDTVLLLDEIDKAEPDLPNDLLEPLDRRRFDLPDGVRIDGRGHIGAAEGAPTLLTIITTNGERELPPAFIRRCILLDLQPPEEPAAALARLVQIGARHLPPTDEAERRRIEAIARLMLEFRVKAREARLRPPGTAEFLDAIRACHRLRVEVSDQDPVWCRLEQAVLDKGGELRRALGARDPA